MGSEMCIRDRLKASDTLNFLVKIRFSFVLVSEDVAFRWAKRLPITFFFSKGLRLLSSALLLGFNPLLVSLLTRSFVPVFLDTFFFFFVFLLRFLLLRLFVYPSARPVKAAAAAARPSIARRTTTKA